MCWRVGSAGNYEEVRGIRSRCVEVCLACGKGVERV